MVPAVEFFETLLHIEQFRHAPFVSAGKSLLQVVVACQQQAGLTKLLCHHGKHASGKVGRHILRQGRHPETLAALDAAGIGIDLAGEEPEEARFAAAVAAEQADPFPLGNLQRDFVKERLAAVGEGNIAQAEQGHGYHPGSR